jgi:tRNA dimethylallyltransferase
MSYPALAILGATGSGKTQLAISLAQQFHGEVISCDALQVYRGMDIGTAKPGNEEQRGIRHHLLDIHNPDEDFSAGEYQRRARQALDEIRNRKHLPVVVGGTGFYFRALTRGLFNGPGRSEKLRARMSAIIARGGGPRVYRALQRVDPRAAARISPADSSRMIRAYEVYLATGKPISWWQDQGSPSLSDFRWLRLGPNWPRPALYERINRRVDKMFQAGLVAEVEKLLEHYPRTAHAFKAIGYRQVVEYLEGKRSLDDAVEDIKRESRRYAKRQTTWFRRDAEIRWLAADRDFEVVLDEAAEITRSFLGAVREGTGPTAVRS